MFTRKSASGHAVDWRPEDAQLADQAAQTIAENEGVESISKLEQHSDKHGGFDYLAKNHYEALRNEYEHLHVEKYGKDSPYYEGQ